MAKLKLRNPKDVYIYTDGSYSPRSGNGGWGYVVVVGHDETLRHSGHMPAPTTNNRMELLAILYALLQVPEPLHYHDSTIIFTDSQSSIAGIEKVTEKMREGISLSIGSSRSYANMDLLNQIAFVLIRQRKRTVTFRWVRGHNGTRWNELADRLATDARVALDLKNT